jgi:hypothetical protein
VGSERYVRCSYASYTPPKQSVQEVGSTFINMAVTDLSAE